MRPLELLPELELPLEEPDDRLALPELRLGLEERPALLPLELEGRLALLRLGLEERPALLPLELEGRLALLRLLELEGRLALLRLEDELLAPELLLLEAEPLERVLLPELRLDADPLERVLLPELRLEAEPLERVLLPELRLEADPLERVLPEAPLELRVVVDLPLEDELRVVLRVVPEEFVPERVVDRVVVDRPSVDRTVERDPERVVVRLPSTAPDRVEPEVTARVAPVRLVERPTVRVSLSFRPEADPRPTVRRPLAALREEAAEARDLRALSAR